MCPLVHSWPIDGEAAQAKQTLHAGQSAKQDVFGHRQFGDQAHFLVNRGDPVLKGMFRRAQRDCLPIDLNGSGGRLRSAGENLDQCRLSSAVFSQESVNATCLESDRNVVQGDGAGIHFADVDGFQGSPDHIGPYSANCFNCSRIFSTSSGLFRV